MEEMSLEKYLEIIEQYKKDNKIDYENGKIRKVFTDNLPKGGKSKNGGNIQNKSVNWYYSIGYKICFMYDNISGWFEVINYNVETKCITLIYNLMEYNIFVGDLKQCKITRILGIRISEYKYKVGDIIKVKSGNIKILETIRLPYGEYGTKAYKYECLICGNTDTISESAILTYGCNICSNNKVIKEINSIWATNPDLIQYFKNIEDTYIYPIQSNRLAWFKCPNCGFEKEMIISNFYKRHSVGCSKCGDGTSYPNKFAFNMLEQILKLTNFKTEYNPKWCKYNFKNKLRQGYYDFYFKLNNKEYVLEMDGGFHSNDNKMSGRTAEDSKDIDRYKDELAKEHRIEVIRIDCNYDNCDRFEYIKNSILNNTLLNELFDFSKIDFNRCEEFSLSSRIKEACNHWNNGIHNTKEIGKIMKLSSSTVCKYLKKGSKIGLTEYSSTISIDKNNIANGLRFKILCSKPIISLDKGVIFESSTDCSDKSEELFGVKLTSGGISRICRGERKHYKSFVFKFIKDLTELEIKQIQYNTQSFNNIITQ